MCKTQIFDTVYDSRDILQATVTHNDLAPICADHFFFFEKPFFEEWDSKRAAFFCNKADAFLLIGSSAFIYSIYTGAGGSCLLSASGNKCFR